MVDKTNMEGEGGGLPKAAMAGVIIVIIIAVVAIVLSQKEKYEVMAPGSMSLDFTLPDLEGKEHKLSEYRGKVVFLNFWATWCEPCKDEIPSMQALYNEHAGEPFVIVAVSVDKEGPDVVKAFAEKYGITFTVLHDRRGRIKEMYKTTGVPETFILDQNGYVAEKFWGPRDWEEQYNIITILDLLKNGPQPPESYKLRKAG